MLFIAFWLRPELYYWWLGTVPANNVPRWPFLFFLILNKAHLYPCVVN